MMMVGLRKIGPDCIALKRLLSRGVTPGPWRFEAKSTAVRLFSPTSRGSYGASV